MFRKIFTVSVLTIIFSYVITACTTPTPERDHVWVVDQNGIEVPITGDWEVVSASNPHTNFPVNMVMAIPPDPAFVEKFSSDGTYKDPSGVTWTKVNVILTDEQHALLLERVDTSVSPNALYAVSKVNDEGIFVAEYSQYPFDASNDNLVVYHKK